MKSLKKKLLCDKGGGIELTPLPSILHSFPSQGGSAAVQDLCHTPNQETTLLEV